MSRPLTPQGLAAFTGDLDRYRHALNRRVIYTPGVRYLAEAGGAYWLIDVIASWIGSASFNEAVAADERIEQLLFWTLDCSDDLGKGRSGVVRAWREGSAPPFAPTAFITQQIAYTHFPLDTVAIWCGFDGEHWTL